MRGTPQAQPEFLTVLNLNAAVPALINDMGPVQPPPENS